MEFFRCAWVRRFKTWGFVTVLPSPFWSDYLKTTSVTGHWKFLLSLKTTTEFKKFLYHLLHLHCLTRSLGNEIILFTMAGLDSNSCRLRLCLSDYIIQNLYWRTWFVCFLLDRHWTVSQVCCPAKGAEWKWQMLLEVN